MITTLNLKKTLEKNILIKDLKKHLGYNPCIADVLEISISCKNCRSMLQGEE